MFVIAMEEYEDFPSNQTVQHLKSVGLYVWLENLRILPLQKAEEPWITENNDSVHK